MRFIGPSLAAIFASVATGWVIYVWRVDSGTEGHAAWMVTFAVAAALGWVGVYGWVAGRPMLMVLGAWGVIWGNWILWSAIVAPIAFAVVTTVIAVLRVRSAVQARRMAVVSR